MLTSKQRAYLRGLANSMNDLFQIGKGGISENVITSREAADVLAEKCRANSVQVIGSKVVLYRPASDPKKRKIELPTEKKRK